MSNTVIARSEATKQSTWKECKLGDAPLEIIDGDRGKNYPSQNEFLSSGYCLFLSTKNVRPNGFDFSDCQFITREKNEILRKGKLQRNDLVLTTRGTVGNIALYGDSIPFENIRINSGMVLIRPNKDELNPTFNLYLFKKLQNDFHTFTSGSAQPQLPIKDLKEMEISLPPLEEQKAIAEVLSSLDDKIDLLHRQNRTLESLAQTLFRQWFIEEAKEEWEEKPLGELLTITSSKRIFYSEYVDSGVPFYRSKEIIELHNTGSTKSELFIAEDRFNEIIEKFGAPQERDILLTSVGTLGTPYRVNTDDRFYFKDGNLTWFKDFKGIPSVIVFHWLKSDLGKEQLDSITIGSTQSALTISGLKEIRLAIPPKETIQRLSNELNSFDEKINQNKKQIQTLENLRDTLLPKLLSGEARVEI